MVTIILLIFIVFGFLNGFRRGFVLQLFSIIGFIGSFLIAAYYCNELGAKLALWLPTPQFSSEGILGTILEALPIAHGLYSLISFVLIFFIARMILRKIAFMLHAVASLPVLNIVNKLLGSVLGFLETYLILFFILYVLTLTPAVQEAIAQSGLATSILENTPFLSEKIQSLSTIVSEFKFL